MGSPVNRKIAGITGTSDWIPLNRYCTGDVSIVTTITSTPTYDIEFTLDKINKAGVLGTETARVVVGGDDLTANANLNIANTPMEAVRIVVASGGSVDVHVMQSGC